MSSIKAIILAPRKSPKLPPTTPIKTIQYLIMIIFFKELTRTKPLIDGWIMINHMGRRERRIEKIQSHQFVTVKIFKFNNPIREEYKIKGINTKPIVWLKTPISKSEVGRQF